MNYNKSVIEDIILDNFIFDIIDQCEQYVRGLNSDDISDLFDNCIDYLDLDSIGELNVINYDINNIDDEVEVSGTFEINVDANGYVHWDDEDFMVEKEDIELIMDFVFYKESDLDYSDFKITEIYI